MGKMWDDNKENGKKNFIPIITKHFIQKLFPKRNPKKNFQKNSMKMQFNLRRVCPENLTKSFLHELFKEINFQEKGRKKKINKIKFIENFVEILRK